MGAREDFDKAVRNGDFAAAALAWTAGPLERTEGVEVFESKLQASLEDRTVTIGQMLQLSSGEYEYLGNSGQDGARLAYIPKDASLDRMEFIRDAAQLLEHMQRLEMPLIDQDAVVAFFAMSERAIQNQQQSVASDLEKADVAAPAPSAERMSMADSLRALVANRTADEQVGAATMSAAQGLAVNDRFYAGTLVAHGAAPYMHDADNPANYFVTLKTPSGHEETIWGKELAVAIGDAKAEPGADIVLAFQGAKQVMVPVKERDGSGKLTGKTIEASATRNSWAIRSIDDLLAAERQAKPLDVEALAEERPTDEATIELPTEGNVGEMPVPQVAVAPEPVLDEAETEAAKEPEPENAIQPATVGRHGGVGDAIARAHRNADDAIMQATGTSPAVVGNGEAEGHDAPAGPKTLLNGRFILRDRGEYFRVADGVTSTRVALVDEVNKIRFVDKQMDTFQAALELAKHKQWEAILVTGSEKFRAEAWHHARMAGLEVVGYEPTEQDLATLKAAQGKGPHTPTIPDERSADERAKDASLAELHDRIIKEGYGAHPAQTENGRHVGKILFESDKHFAQDTGRKVATVHEKENFPPAALRDAVEKGDVVKLQYKSGKGVIEAAKDRAKDRGR